MDNTKRVDPNIADIQLPTYSQRIFESGWQVMPIDARLSAFDVFFESAKCFWGLIWTPAMAERGILSLDVGGLQEFDNSILIHQVPDIDDALRKESF